MINAKHRILVTMESIVGSLVFKLLEASRKGICTVLKPVIPWEKCNTAIVVLIKKLFKDRIILRVAANGLRFNVRWPSLDLKVLEEVILRRCYQLLQGFEPKEGDIIIDLGAHIGAYTVYAAKRGAYVIAVEPASTNIKLLLQNIKLNKVENKVKIVKAAVAGSRDVTKFPVESLDLNTGSFSIFRSKSTWIKYEKVPVLVLDDIVTLACVDSIRIVKADIEGAEKELIHGALQVLKNKRPRIVLEVHGRDILWKLLRELRAHRYVVLGIIKARCCSCDIKGDLYYLYAQPGD